MYSYNDRTMNTHVALSFWISKLPPLAKPYYLWSSRSDAMVRERCTYSLVIKNPSISASWFFNCSVSTRWEHNICFRYENDNYLSPSQTPPSGSWELESLMFTIELRDALASDLRRRFFLWFSRTRSWECGCKMLLTSTILKVLN